MPKTPYRVINPQTLHFDDFQGIEIEDGGQSITAEYQCDSPEVFVRFMSWDEKSKTGHAEMAPFRVDPDNVIVTVSQGHVPVTGPAQSLSDHDLEWARHQICQMIGSQHDAIAQGAHPARQTSQSATALMQAALEDARARLVEIDAEIQSRIAND